MEKCEKYNYWLEVLKNHLMILMKIHPTKNFSIQKSILATFTRRYNLIHSLVENAPAMTCYYVTEVEERLSS